MQRAALRRGGREADAGHLAKRAAGGARRAAVENRGGAGGGTKVVRLLGTLGKQSKERGGGGLGVCVALLSIVV
jgi:hypothetical protein